MERTMSRISILGAALATLAFVDTAHAQTLNSGCNASGLGPNGQPCVELRPLDPNRFNNTSINAANADQFDRLDTRTLAQTYECLRPEDRATRGAGNGVLLIEDCGTPLSAAELGPTKPYLGTTGQAAPAPTPQIAAAPPAPTPTVAATPPATLPPAPAPIIPASTIVTAPAGPVLASPTVFSGISGAAVGAGLVAAAGLAAIIVATSDGSSSPSTN